MAVVTSTNEGRQNVDAVRSHIITQIFTAAHLPVTISNALDHL